MDEWLCSRNEYGEALSSTMSVLQEGLTTGKCHKGRLCCPFESFGLPPFRVLISIWDHGTPTSAEVTAFA